MYVVTAIPQHRMDDPQKLLGDDDKCRGPYHAPSDEARIVVAHDPVLSYGPDGRVVEDLPKEAPSPLRYPLLSLSLSRAYLKEVKAGELHDLRLCPEL